MSNISVGGSYDRALLYLIQCISPLHVGSGESHEGFVDIPIQRDHLDFPVIWSSSLKGAIRNAFRNLVKDNEKDTKIENEIFGPDSSDSSTDMHASAVLIMDANLLLMPVRSLYGLFAFCTHPYLLKQLYEKISVLHKGNDLLTKLESFINDNKGKVICSSKTIVKDDKIILKEEEIGNVQENQEFRNIFEKLLPNGIKFKEDILDRLVMLNDNYADIIKRSTIIQPRIKLNYKTKHVEEGALWTEEVLPELSILSTLMLIRSSRRNSNMNSEKIIQKLAETFGKNKNSNPDQFYIVLGGRETLGRGIIKFNHIQLS
jgi:CRISPR-associated protein Cmr4